MTIQFNNNQSDAEPYRKFNYTVRVDNTTIGGFTQISGISMNASVMEYQEGGVHDSTHQFPTDISYSNVKLHRGATAHSDFINWITQSTTTQQKSVQKPVEIALNDTQGTMQKGWKLIGAYPVQWSGPEMAAQSNGQFAMELVELSCEKITPMSGSN